MGEPLDWNWQVAPRFGFALIAGPQAETVTMNTFGIDP